MSDDLVVGRQGDVRLSHESVSRRHARLERRAEGWVLSDLDSRNGTFVNRAAVRTAVLRPGDVVRFGSVAFTFESVAEDAAEEAETGASIPVASAEEPVRSDAFRAIVGRSPALRDAMELAVRAARSNATVLVCGESGTGKELFARLIWAESHRRAGRFLAVNCSAIEPTLLGSTLFGHEKGAFTGADRRKEGLFKEADGGTLFLDEIGDISLEMQAKLLRVLQEGEFMRVGGTETVASDVRIICATNRDLPKAIAERKFRQDLYYRLNIVKIDIPPLRDRVEDIPRLVAHFARSAQEGASAKTFTARALAALAAYAWPGNVRELQNVVARASILAEGAEVDLEDLPAEVREPGGDDAAPGSLAAVEAAHVRAALAASGGNKKRAAEMLGISRSTLYAWLRGQPASDSELQGQGETVT